MRISFEALDDGAIYRDVQVQAQYSSIFIGPIMGSEPYCPMRLWAVCSICDADAMGGCRIGYCSTIMLGRLGQRVRSASRSINDHRDESDNDHRDYHAHDEDLLSEGSDRKSVV